MRQLGGHQDVHEPVAIHIGHGGIFGRRSIQPLGHGNVVPLRRVGAAKGDAHMPFGRGHEAGREVRRVVTGVGFVHRHNVHKPVPVDVGHHQAIAPAEHKVEHGGVIHQMLAPADVAAVAGGGLGKLVAHALRQQRVTQPRAGQGQPQACATGCGGGEGHGGVL